MYDEDEDETDYDGRDENESPNDDDPGFVPSGPGFVPPPHSPYMPGQGFVPPGQGFVPPGQGFVPPGQGFVPPGQGFVPPGQRPFTPPPQSPYMPPGEPPYMPGQGPFASPGQGQGPPSPPFGPSAPPPHVGPLPNFGASATSAHHQASSPAIPDVWQDNPILRKVQANERHVRAMHGGDQFIDNLKQELGYRLNKASPWQGSLGRPCNPVLDLVINTFTPHDGPIQVTELCLRTYLQYYHLYDAAFSDLIPNDFRQLAHKRSFESGHSPTAYTSWKGYQSMLSTPGQPMAIKGLTTGLRSLDPLVLGLEGLTFIGGATGIGKTSLAISAILHSMKSNPRLGALIFAIDGSMGEARFFEKFLGHEAGLAAHQLRLREQTPEYVAALESASPLLDPLMGRMLIVGAKQLTRDADLLHDPALAVPAAFGADSVCRYLAKLQQASGMSEFVILFDKVQDIPTSKSSSLDADAERLLTLQQVNHLTRSHRSPYGASIICTSAVPKESANASTLGPNHLLGSGKLGYDADTVVMLSAAAPSAAIAEVVDLNVSVVKCRSGKLGSIPIHFDHARCRFHEPNAGASAVPKKAAKKRPGPDPLKGVKDS